MAARVNAGVKTSASQPALSFPRSARLLEHARFEAVYKTGKRHFSTSMTCFYTLRPTDHLAGARVGFTVGRVFGGAVVRNRIKRRLRDAVRHQLIELNQNLSERKLAAEIVINPKKSVNDAPLATLRAEVARAFQVISAAQAAVVEPGPDQGGPKA